MSTPKKRFSELILDDIALQLHDAVKNRNSIDPPSETHGIDYAAAVEVRRRMANLLGRYAGLPSGFKLAFTSPATQQVLGIDAPEFGYLFSAFQIAHGTPVDVGSLCEPYAEPELAFVMAKDLEGPGVVVDDVLDAVKCIRPAIEIVDSRIGLLKAKTVDMVADNVLFGRLVLGDGEFSPDEVDLENTPVKIMVDGESEESVTGKVMGNPAAAVAWLANRLAETNGREGAISRGDIIMSGSCTRYFPVGKGSSAVADFGPLGELRVDFV
ncbi:MAG: hypothetical protein J4F49_03980 [Rhodobacteraceae bacterium]|nr:hypothetical protein [Paracoccaceae bacterium]